MKLFPLLQPIIDKQPYLVTPFVREYFWHADKPAANKPYFYGKWSLKWCFSVIHQHINESQLKALTHHTVTELAIMPPEEAEDTAQFKAITLAAMAPYKALLNDTKTTINVLKLPVVTIGPYTFCINQTPNNLTSMIFRKTSADAIIFHNPETQSAGVSLRVNSKINLLQGFKQYLADTLIQSEPGWRQQTETLLINFGIQSKTPTRHTINSLKEIISNYFNKLS